MEPFSQSQAFVVALCEFTSYFFLHVLTTWANLKKFYGKNKIHTQKIKNKILKTDGKY
jgi:hypothetical protein